MILPKYEHFKTCETMRNKSAFNIGLICHEMMIISDLLPFKTITDECLDEISRFAN